LRPSARRPEPRWRGGCQHRQQASCCDQARPVAEHSGRKAVTRDDQPGSFGRILELAGADRRQRQIPERTAPLPKLVASFRDDALGLGAGIEPSERLQPLDPREPVAPLAAALGIEKVLGKCAGVLCRETERADPLLDLHGGEHTYAMVPEAMLENGVPQSTGWFVVNARDGRWLHNELGAYCGFEGKGEARFEQLGINLNVLPPGKPMAMYH